MEWIKIFDNLGKALEAMPNQTSRLVKIGERKICLSSHNGQLHAMDDHCPHMGASLSQGKVNYLGEVICPLHEYRYHPKTGQEVNNQCDGAKIIPVKVDDSGVYLLID